MWACGSPCSCHHCQYGTRRVCQPSARCMRRRSLVPPRSCPSLNAKWAGPSASIATRCVVCQRCGVVCQQWHTSMDVPSDVPVERAQRRSTAIPPGPSTPPRTSAPVPSPPPPPPPDPPRASLQHDQCHNTVCFLSQTWKREAALVDRCCRTWMSDAALTAPSASSCCSNRSTAWACCGVPRPSRRRATSAWCHWNRSRWASRGRAAAAAMVSAVTAGWWKQPHTARLHAVTVIAWCM